MTRKLNIDNGYSDTKEGRPAGNSTYKKLAVQWLNEVQFFNQTFVRVDSFVLRNRQLLIAANRYIKLSEKFIGKHGENLQFCRSLENLVVFRNY